MYITRKCYESKFCTKRFLQKESLDIHTKVIHIGWKTHKCEKYFGQKSSNLKRHLEEVHKNDQN